jgi:hypothetical protein
MHPTPTYLPMLLHGASLVVAAAQPAPELPWYLKLLALLCIVGFYVVLAWLSKRP